MPTLLRSTFIGIALEAKQSDLPEPAQFDTWNDLVQATVTSPHEAAATTDAYPTVEAAAYAGADKLLLGELKTLKAGQHIPNDRCMVTLSPEYRDRTTLHWGRLRQADYLEADTTHPVILDPVHQITKLTSGVSTLVCWRASIQMPSCFPLVVHCQAWHKISIQVNLCVHLDQRTADL